MPNAEHLSTADVAVRLGVNVATINRYVRTGRLKPAIQFPGPTGARLYDPADIDALAADLAAVARVSTDEERADNARRHTAARRAMYPEPPAATA